MFQFGRNGVPQPLEGAWRLVSTCCCRGSASVGRERPFAGEQKVTYRSQGVEIAPRATSSGVWIDSGNM